MSASLDLADIFDKGYLKYLVLRNNQVYRPPSGRKALLLGGTITHVTGTDTFLDLVDALADTEFIGMRRKIGNAVATQLAPIFPIVNETGGHNAVWTPNIFDASKHLLFLGAADAKADVVVIEW